MFSDRYIFASALQKSIRRGLTSHALNYANILGENDYNYLIYRLGIILTEDIGVSNTSLINEYLDLKISKKAIETAGGMDFIRKIISKACESNKDRSSCDIAYFSSHVTDWAIQKPEFQKLINSPKEYRLSIIKDFILQEINPALKINLIWSALGQRKYPNELLSYLKLFDFPKLKNGKDDDSVDNFRYLLENLNLSEEEIRAIINAHATQNEFMCLGMSITYFERNKFFKSQIEQNLKFSPQIQKKDFSQDSVSIMKDYGIEILNAAIDSHTSQGKAAYTMFLKKQSHYSHYMKQKGFDFNQIQNLLPFLMFRIEGHEVNNREYFKFASTAMSIGSQVSLNRILGLPFNDKTYSFIEMASVLSQDIPAINEFREKALNFNSKPIQRAGFNS